MKHLGNNDYVEYSTTDITNSPVYFQSINHYVSVRLVFSQCGERWRVGGELCLRYRQHQHGQSNLHSKLPRHTQISCCDSPHNETDSVPADK